MLTGAGVSAASGLATFRGQNGLWDSNEVETLHHADQLPDSASRLWQLWGPMREPQLRPPAIR